MKALTVTETSSGSVDSGMAVAMTWSMRAAVDALRVEDLGPEVDVTTLDEVASLVLVHLVLVGDVDELVIAEALGVGNVGEVRVALLAVLADNQRVVEVVLLEERLGVVVRVDRDLGNGVVDLLVGRALLDLLVEPGKDELEAVALLNLGDELIDGERAGDREEEVLDGGLVAVDVEKTTNDLGSTGGVDTLDVDLDEVGKTVLVEVENKVVNKVEAVADNDEGSWSESLASLRKFLTFSGL
jgi:hypothetical protein